jgi:hypothetical protein
MPTLLSAYNANPKVAKNEKLGKAGAVLHLAPANLSGYEVCQGSSAGCRAACLHYAGNPAFANNKMKARIARTKLFFERRDDFMTQLHKEITAHVKRSGRLGLDPVVRLNGTSDIIWERKKCGDFANIMEAFPTVQFYDYTALYRKVNVPNYHLTFSLKEDNQDKAQAALDAGWNLAVVFQAKALPDTFMGLPVIDGDETDYRPADPKGCVVGLKVKGPKGKADTSGFTVLL